MCTLSPLSFRDCGDAQSDHRSIARSSTHGCAFRATLCEKERSAGNQLPWSDLRGHLGMGMSPGEVIAYRLYAVYCVEIARELADPGRKAALLGIAQAWIVLADQVEKASGAKRGIQHPHSDEP